MKGRGKITLLLEAMAILALVLASSAVAGEGGAATVDELIEQCKGKTSFADLLPMVHPDNQAMVGMAVEMITAFAPMMAMEGDEADANAQGEKLTAELEALEAKYGLKEPPEDAPSGDTPEGMAMLARYTFDGVDLAAYITAAEEWLAGVLPQEALDEGLVPDFNQVENIEIDGDLATATVAGRPIKFTQIDGRWYLLVEL